MMIYRTKRLRLEPLTKGLMESPNYKLWTYDPDVTKYNTQGLFSHPLDETIWAITVKCVDEADWRGYDTYIGNVSLDSINEINRSAGFTIVIGAKKHWGKGYGLEALTAVFDYGFNTLNLNRIWTGTAATNMGMRRIAEKLGMTREGVFREATYLNGRYIDVIEYGILKGEWEHRQLIEGRKGRQSQPDLPLKKEGPPPKPIPSPVRMIKEDDTSGGRK